MLTALAFHEAIEGLGRFGDIPYIIIYQGWYSNPQFIVWALLLICFALLVVWYRFSKKSLRVTVLAGTLGFALWVTVTQSDRIVVTHHDWMGFESIQTVAAPRSPLWRAPKPENVSDGMKSWSDLFPSGGGGGPVGEPRLVMNWSWFCVRMFVYTLVPFLMASGALTALLRYRRVRPLT